MSLAACHLLNHFSHGWSCYVSSSRGKKDANQLQSIPSSFCDDVSTCIISLLLQIHLAHMQPKYKIGGVSRDSPYFGYEFDVKLHFTDKYPHE